MSDDFDSLLKKEFLEEAREMLDKVEEYFLEFEQHIDNEEVIHKIFRLAHTIKGSALSCGFHDLGHFSHAIETLLDKIRTHEIIASTAMVDVMLLANDRLRTYVQALTRDNTAYVDTSDVVAVIEAALGSDRLKKPEGPPAAAFGFFDDEPEPTVEVIAPFDSTQALLELEALGLSLYTSMARRVLAKCPPTEADLYRLEKLLHKLKIIRSSGGGV